MSLRIRDLTPGTLLREDPPTGHVSKFRDGTRRVRRIMTHGVNVLSLSPPYVSVNASYADPPYEQCMILGATLDSAVDSKLHRDTYGTLCNALRYEVYEAQGNRRPVSAMPNWVDSYQSLVMNEMTRNELFWELSRMWVSDAMAHTGELEIDMGRMLVMAFEDKLGLVAMEDRQGMPRFARFPISMDPDLPDGRIVVTRSPIQ